MVQIEVCRQVDLGNNEPEVVGHSNWLMNHWVRWLTDQGYHVELQGDEFELLSSASAA